jgi:alpha-galactosidase
MKMNANYFLLISCVAITLLNMVSCSKNTGAISSGPLQVEVNDQMFTRVSTNLTTIPFNNEFRQSEYLVTDSDTIGVFKLRSSDVQKISVFAGEGNSYTYNGTAENPDQKITKILTINTYKNYEGWAFYTVEFVNTGNKDIVVKKWVNHSYKFDSRKDVPDFWSFQASSTGARKSWILPVDTGFYQKNYMGMNDPDYGGGIPVLDLWRKDIGIAIGHASLKPELASLPVSMGKDDNYSTIGIEYAVNDTLHPGDTLKTLETFVTVHTSDCFSTLKQYAAFMAKKGIVMPDSEPLAFEPAWCAWGYMRKFTVDEVIGTLTKVKELGFTWVTLDDGFQNAEGDWFPNPVTFPGGEAQMKKLVDTIHAMGFKAQLWWAPMAVDPGTKLLAEQPDIILKNADGSPQVISWWDSYYMSPVSKSALDHTKEMVDMFIGEWGFDGLKLDGQHLNACPPDYNPAHNLTHPNVAPESMPDFFKLIYETAHQIKPGALIQLCPCGDAMSYYNMPYANQFVASDPVGSVQVRSKGWTFKALAPNTAYFGDHVELSDEQNDFASTIGIGAVPGTKFTWPKDNPFVTEGHFVLTPEKEKEWNKWIRIYKEHMLSKGEYLGGLYDIGYDIPETHVIRKSDTLFYGFYAKNWKGTLKFRGLSEESYKVIDYANNRDLGVLLKEKPELDLSFDKYLLLMVYPKR